MSTNGKHTPGQLPYSHRLAETNSLMGIETGAVAVVDANGFEICRIRTFGGIVETLQQAQDMAQLFASAPDLLAARAKRLDQERRYLASFHGADKVGGTATLLKVWIAEDEAAIECTEKG